MANPQVENGHIRIANELFEAICRTALSGREFQVLCGVLRLTYGWQKKTEPISLKKLQDMTGIKERTWVMRLLGNLEQRNIIQATHRQGVTTIYGINKDYDQWVGCETGNTCATGNTRVMDSTSTCGTSDTSTCGTGHYGSGLDTLLHERHVQPVQRHTASASQFSDEPKEKLPQLLQWWLDTTQRYPTSRDREVSSRLMKHPKWKPHIAVACADLNYQEAQQNGTQVSGIAYFEPAIMRALETGQMPGQKKSEPKKVKRW